MMELSAMTDQELQALRGAVEYELYNRQLKQSIFSTSTNPPPLPVLGEPFFGEHIREAKAIIKGAFCK